VFTEPILSTGSAAAIRNQDLAGFTATPLRETGTVDLEWSTAAGMEIALFELYRSTDRENWDLLTTVSGETSSQKGKNYRYTDSNVESGTAYYKLEWYDGFANRKQSIINTNIPQGPVSYKSYPNPTTGTVSISAEKETISPTSRIRVISVDGQRYKVPTKFENGQVEVDLSEVPEGFYVVELKDGFVRIQKN